MQTTHSRSPSWSASAVALAPIVLVLVGWRLVEFFSPQSIPANFTPMLAMALFAGACFTNRAAAFGVPLAAMVLSDLVIGFSSLSVLVYALIAAAVWLGAHTLAARPGWLRIVLVAVGGATGFFIVTNFAVWLFFDLYPHTVSGLLAAYVAAIPFYTHGTLAGTVIFSLALFALYAGLLSIRPRVSY